MELKQWIWSVCSLFLLAACGANETQLEKKRTDTTLTQTDTTIPSASLPSENPSATTAIETYLRTRMPQWTLPDTSEWEPYWYRQFDKGANKVYRAQADFDGNGQTDFAYILKTLGGQYTVWAFMRNQDSFVVKKVYDIIRYADKVHVGLDTLKAGSYHDLNSADPSSASVQTEHPAIHVIFFETAAKAYYWKDGDFHLIQTGD